MKDAFENKTLQLEALGGGRRGPRDRESYSGSRDLERPREPDEEGREAAAGVREGPYTAQAGGPQQVVAAGQRTWAMGPVRGNLGPRLLETLHTHVGRLRDLGRELILFLTPSAL